MVRAWPQSRSGRACIAAGTLAWGACVFAAEPAATEPPASPRKEPAPGQPLDAARRDFQSIKATRDPSQQPKDTLPKMGLPSLSPGGGEPLPSAPGRTEPAPPGRKPANWLVDAMEKSEREAAGRRGDRRGEAPLDDLRGEAAGLRQRERESSEPSERRGGLSSTKATGLGGADSGNPLNRYLGDWMTARDYAVLKPALEMPAPGRNGVEREPPILPVTLSTPAVAPQPGSPIAAAAGKLPVAPRENPYLQPVAPIAAPVISPPRRANTGGNGNAPGAAPILAPTVAMPAPVAAPGPTQPPPRSQIPDFVKPATDEKYFKQLKRF